jgi:predicted O-linked N-acetylglucosamine transferase (SPINDLY family)
LEQAVPMSRNGRFAPGKAGAGSGGSVRALLDRAGGLLSTGKGGEAVPLIQQAIAMARANPEAAHMLGVAYLQSGQPAAGIEALKRAMMLAPTAAPVLNHLGVALCQAGRGGEGLPYLRKAVALAPGMADIRNNLAQGLNAAGDHLGAAEHYHAALAGAPQMAAAWQGLAAALHKAGDLNAALEATEAALARFADQGGFHASRGRILLDLHRSAEAEAAFRAALALDPAHAEAASNLGTLVEQQGHLAEALALYQTATRGRPELADAWFNLGNAFEKRGDLAGARAALDRCVALRPQSARTLAALIAVRRKLCDWPGLDDQVQTLAGLIAANADPADVPAPFSLLSLMIDAGLQRRCAELHSQTIERRAAAFLPLVGEFEPRLRGEGDGRLRIGYLSPDFREHPIAQLMAGVIEAHDRSRFEVSAWSLGPDDGSSFRRRIEVGVDRFEDLRDLDTAAATTRMRQARLDIVVDLAGYTAHARPEILALRVAPLQVNYLGFPGSMGASFIDYILVDGIVAGEGDERLYSERLVRLPDCYQANDNRATIDSGPVVRADFDLPDDAFVFCCFSMNYKIDAVLLDAWVAILAAAPGSVLWLFRTDAAAADNLQREFAARGVAAGGVFFADRLPKARHLARHRLADLFLDSFAYGAHTTASDALWAGLPVLTLRGDTFARRVGASIVSAAGLPDLVVNDVNGYIAAAVEIAATPGRAAALKARLAENRPACPLFSTPAIARNLEAAYLSMNAPANLHELK